MNESSSIEGPAGAAGDDDSTPPAKEGDPFRKNYASKRDAALERLKCNLASLVSYCQPPVDGQAEIDEKAEGPISQWLEKQRILWPSHELLRQIDDDVIELAAAGRKKPILPIWKAFEQVDRRMPKLRLKSRLDALIRRALERVSGESELGKAAQAPGSVSAHCLLSDILCGERSLARLLDEDRSRTVLKAKFCALLEWLLVNGHPLAKDFGPVAEHYVLDAAAWSKRKRLLQIKASRARMRRHRKKSFLKTRNTI